MRSAIILTGGKSSRIGIDKGLQILENKPLIIHTLNKIIECVDEAIIVTGSEEQKLFYDELKINANIITDEMRFDSPIMGAYSGFKNAKNKYCVLVGSDMPFLNKEVINLLFEKVENHDAATPLWPNGWVEPLLSVYKTDSAIKISHNLIVKGEKKLGLILRNLKDVVKISIEEIRIIDPELITLFDIDTVDDLRKAERILSSLNKLKKFS